MSISISTTPLATLGKIGWEYTKRLTLNGHNPAQLTAFLDALNTRALVLMNAAYSVVQLAVTNEEYAGVSEWLAGEATIAEGSIVRVSSTTDDLTDNALATAKGGAVAQYDLFFISGADAVTYEGNGTGLAVQAHLDAAYALGSEYLSSVAFTTAATAGSRT